MTHLDSRTRQWVSVFGDVKRKARQCKAKSKRSGQRCRRPACTGKSVCHIHGGRSTGAKTAGGRRAVVIANTAHGRETRAKRRKRADKLRDMRKLEKIMQGLGMFE